MAEETQEAAPQQDSDAPVVEAPKVEEVKTKTQTLQQIAQAQGVQVPQQMDADKFMGQLILSHHMGLSAVLGAFKKLSKHGKDRVFTAIMQLPMNDLPSFLNGQFEREVYLGAQKLAMERAAIIFNRAKREKSAEEIALAKFKAEQAAKKNIILTDSTEPAKVEESKPDTKENENVGQQSAPETVQVEQSGISAQS